MTSPSEDPTSEVDRSPASLVAPVEAEQAPILARPFYPREGAVSPLTASLAHVPELLEVALPFFGRVLGPTSVDVRTKEIVLSLFHVPVDVAGGAVVGLAVAVPVFGWLGRSESRRAGAGTSATRLSSA